MSELTRPAAGIAGGRTVVTTAGTAVQLTATQTSSLSLSITAETDNTGLIAVGDADVVAAAGTQTNALVILNAGDTISVDINNLTHIYLDSTVNGDGVAYGYTTR